MEWESGAAEFREVKSALTLKLQSPESARTVHRSSEHDATHVEITAPLLITQLVGGQLLFSWQNASHREPNLLQFPPPFDILRQISIPTGTSLHSRYLFTSRFYCERLRGSSIRQRCSSQSQIRSSAPK